MSHGLAVAHIVLANIGILFGLLVAMAMCRNWKGRAFWFVVIVTLGVFANIGMFNWLDRGACTAHGPLLGRTTHVTCMEGFEHKEWDVYD